MHPEFRNRFPAKCRGSTPWTGGLGCRNRRMGIYFSIHKEKVRLHLSFLEIKPLTPDSSKCSLASSTRCSRSTSGKQRKVRPAAAVRGHHGSAAGRLPR